MNRLAAVLIITFFFFRLQSFCQDFPMLHFTTEDGLPSNTIYSLHRDSKGYLWIATDKGIARYNGIKFEVFTTFNGLPDNEIFFFNEDLEGRLWLGSYNGELCYYKDGIFHNAKNTPFLKLPFKAPFITHILIEKDSSVTFVFYEGLKFINMRHDRFKTFDLKNIPDIMSFSVRHVKKITENKYLLVLHDKTIEIDTFYHVENKKMLRNKILNLTYSQQQYNVYDSNSIMTPDLKIRWKFPKGFVGNNLIYQAYFSGNSCLVTTNHGIFIDSLQILKNAKVSSVTQDRQGNYWMSTLDNGIYAINKTFQNTKIYKNVYKGKVQYACERNNRIFFTTTNNVLNQLTDGNVNTLFDFNKYAPTEAKYPQQGFFIDKKYKFFYCYNSATIVADNVLSKKIRTDRYPCEFTNAGTMKTLISVGDKLYINYSYKLVLADYKQTKPGQFTSGHPQPGVAKQVSDTIERGRILAMRQAPDQSIWYSTSNSIYKIIDDYASFQPLYRNIAFKSFCFQGANLVGYTTDNVLLVCRNNHNHISIDTIPWQDCIWDKFYLLDSIHMLISTNNFYRLLTVPGNNSAKPHINTIENPLIPLGPEVICSDSANCYFFNDGSITCISINSLISERPESPQLFFTTLKTGKKNYSVNNELELPFSEARNITLSFSTLSFSSNNVSYQYSITKKEKDNWRPINSEEINLVNTGYGDYDIKIRAKTISSDYSVPVVFHLHILRPVWVTWWFITLSCCAVFAVIWLFIRRRIANELREKEREHTNELRFMRSEYKALNALMNPHFIFNTLNNVQGLVNRNDKVAANEYLRIFADLIRQNMHNISKELIPLQKETDLVVNYLLLEKLRFKELLNYEINIEDDLDLSEIMVSPLLIQPLVENSIKHGILPLNSVDGFISINISAIENKLYIEVKDNGVGIEHSQSKSSAAHESYGLENIRKRLQQLSIIQNKEITFHINEVVSETGKLQWTVATISLSIA